jgi:hypothetical protein
MGYEAKKTEHCGAKHGNGAYWSHKWEAKKESNRIRRENAKREIRDGVTVAMDQEPTGSPPGTGFHR